MRCAVRPYVYAFCVEPYNVYCSYVLRLSGARERSNRSHAPGKKLCANFVCECMLVRRFFSLLFSITPVFVIWIYICRFIARAHSTVYIFCAVCVSFTSTSERTWERGRMRERERYICVAALCASLSHYFCVCCVWECDCVDLCALGVRSSAFLFEITSLMSVAHSIHSLASICIYLRHAHTHTAEKQQQEKEKEAEKMYEANCSSSI